MDILEKIIIPLLSALIGGVLAFIYQKRLQSLADKKNILASLMAYRHLGTSDEDFVKALNLVVVVYYDDKKVIEAFHQYLTAFRHGQYSDGQRLDAVFHLMSLMAKSIGYRQLKHTEIKEFFVQTYPQPLEQVDRSG